MLNYYRQIKISLAVFLIILLTVGSVSHIIYFKVQQYCIKKEIKQRLKKGVPKNELHTFNFTNAEIKNTNELEFINDHEFRYKGKMYDIVYQETLNDTIIFQCVSDEQETILFTQLDKLVQQQSKSNQEKNRQLFKLLNFHFTPTDYIDFSIHTLIHSKQLSQYNYSVKTWCTKIELPPPQFTFYH